MNVARNPHICSAFFKTTIDLFIESLLEKVMKTLWYWIRIEIQFRGSLHAHYFAKFLEQSSRAINWVDKPWKYNKEGNLPFKINSKGNKRN